MNMVFFSIQIVIQMFRFFLFSRSETVGDVQVPSFIQLKAILYTCLREMIQRKTAEACIWQSEN